MALADGKSRVKSGPLTMHTKTAIHVAELVTQVNDIIRQITSYKNLLGLSCYASGQGIWKSVRVRSHSFGQKSHQIAQFLQNCIIINYLAKIHNFTLLGQNCTFSHFLANIALLWNKIALFPVFPTLFQMLCQGDACWKFSKWLTHKQYVIHTKVGLGSICFLSLKIP